jgi:protein-S-isoprenylcysteine O-methyltransferase Ste14
MTISLLFRVFSCIWFASEVIVAVATRTRGGKGNVRDRGSMLILWIAITTAITGCEWLSAVVTAPLFGGAPWLRLASLLVLLTGIVIRWTAIFTLGKAFSANVAIREEQKLKRNGLYRFVRHPVVLGPPLDLAGYRSAFAQLGRTLGADHSHNGGTHLPDLHRRSGAI